MSIHIIAMLDLGEALIMWEHNAKTMLLKIWVSLIIFSIILNIIWEFVLFK